MVQLQKITLVTCYSEFEEYLQIFFGEMLANTDNDGELIFGP